ncbi:hypothetical protein M011DRAFT_462755 [Sporormia fimetaria CBS 119925]|uniref:BZIP domain-containing protein n=1 Tax=Sporormia fimetaria CBS 119925 TaxID=1340428 RepID=A0A6A6UW38_9PLEO|nr:hypothetical protein M011DRAFT_462755 [Sporormia fimetaria CBS 119925]
MHEDPAASLPSPASNPADNARSTHSQSSSPSPLTELSNFVRPSGSRVPTLAPLTTKPIIATASPSGYDSAYPSPVGGGPGALGPTSTSYVIPPRPKPGRKPATDEPASKRKAQNRESQRAFRARKAAKLAEMKTEAELAEMRYSHDVNEKLIEIQEKERQIQALEVMVNQLRESQHSIVQERDSWRDKALQLEELLKHARDQRPSSSQLRDKQPTLPAFGQLTTPSRTYDTSEASVGTCGTCRPGTSCLCLDAITSSTAPDFMPAVPLASASSHRSNTDKAPNRGNTKQTPSFFEEREIDFTAQFSKPSRRQEPDTRSSIAFLTHSNQPEAAPEAGPDEAGCGFCTNASYCFCRDAGQQDLDKAMQDDEPRPVPTPTKNWPSREESMSDKPSSTTASTIGPGSCDACQRDPKQRAWCQRVAALRTPAGSAPTSRRNSFARPSPQPQPTTEPHTGFSAAPNPNSSSIGCSDAYKLFDGRVPTDPDSMDWSTLRPIAPDTQRGPLPSISAASARTYSALELDTAGVIATLQQTMGQLAPRAQDGRHADLVRIAQEQQRMSRSPGM